MFSNQNWQKVLDGCTLSSKIPYFAQKIGGSFSVEVSNNLSGLFGTVIKILVLPSATKKILLFAFWNEIVILQFFPWNWETLKLSPKLLPKLTTKLWLKLSQKNYVSKKYLQSCLQVTTKLPTLFYSVKLCINIKLETDNRQKRIYGLMSLHLHLRAD